MSIRWLVNTSLLLFIHSLLHGNQQLTVKKLLTTVAQITVQITFYVILRNIIIAQVLSKVPLHQSQLTVLSVD